MTRIYIVGGYVRDKILGVESNDIDYAVETESFESMREYILERSGTIFIEKPEFVTIKARLDGDVVDFVLCRKDGKYTDGRHPDNVIAGDIYDDLSRRDFTMNAIAYNIENAEYIDPHDGLADIEDKLIRCVGRTGQRLAEDPLRVLRAIRFAITKGFRIDAEIKRWLHESFLISSLIETVSEDRIREEIHKMLKYDTNLTLFYINQFEELFSRIFDETDIWLMATTKD